MCVKLPSGDLKPDPYPLHFTSIYIYRVIIALRVCGLHNFFFFLSVNSFIPFSLRSYFGRSILVKSHAWMISDRGKNLFVRPLLVNFYVVSVPFFDVTSSIASDPFFFFCIISLYSVAFFQCNFSCGE